MTSKQIFFVMIAVTTLLGIGILGAAAFGNVMLQQESQKLVSLKLDNRVLEEQQASLKQANKDIDKYTELEKEAKAIVPQDKDQAQAVREIVKIANHSGIKLATISFSASSLGSAAAPVTAPSGNSGATPTPKATTPPVTQVKPVENIPGVYVMEISIQQDSTQPISYSSFIDFLNRLEQNRRTAQVATVTIQPSSQNANKLTFSLVVNVYIKP